MLDRYPHLTVHEQRELHRLKCEVSYDRHFGANAIAAAEGDALGEALAILEKVARRRCDCPPENMCPTCQAKAFLARTKGATDEKNPHH